MDLIELLFHQPYNKGQFLVDAGIVKRRAARDFLKKLEEIGVLSVHKVGKEYLYLNTKLYEILKNNVSIPATRNKNVSLKQKNIDMFWFLVYGDDTLRDGCNMSTNFIFLDTFLVYGHDLGMKIEVIKPKRMFSGKGKEVKKSMDFANEKRRFY